MTQTTIRCVVAVLLIGSLLVGEVPSIASEGPFVVLSDSSPDTCCSDVETCDPDSEPGTHGETGDEDCCPGGCTECGLACCGGSVSILPVFCNMDVAAQSSCSLSGDGRRTSSFDHSRIDHPPRD